MKNASHLVQSAHLDLQLAPSVMPVPEWDYYTDPHAWPSALWEPKRRALPAKAVVRDVCNATLPIQPSALSVARTSSSLMVRAYRNVLLGTLPNSGRTCVSA